MTYEDFLKNKIAIAKLEGFEVTLSDLPDVLKPHQADIVRWACKGGSRAIFAQFGLGKTLIQLAIMQQVVKQEGGKTLIVCPLGVKQEFVRDAETLLNMRVQYVRTNAEAEEADTPYLITNYERAGRTA